jgi:hypothetical protein
MSMDRLQTKCLLGSAVLHGAVAMTLLLTTAFSGRKHDEDGHLDRRQVERWFARCRASGAHAGSAYAGGAHSRRPYSAAGHASHAAA